MPAKVKLELVGQDGNAFALMGAFERAARQQGWEKNEIDAVLQECMKGDYSHLLVTLMKNTESPEGDEDED